jgi:peptidoglycan-associated lipoprotein
MRLNSLINKIWILLILPLFLTTGCSIKSRIEKADQVFAAGQYNEASQLYNRLYTKVSSADRPLKARMAFQQAECLRLLNNNRSDAMYQRAVRMNYSDSVVYLQLARALHRNARYADAQKNYRVYLNFDSLSVLATNGLIATEKAAVWRARPTRYVVRREPSLYKRNTYFFSPSFQGSDTDVLYFSSTLTDPKKKSEPNRVTAQPNSAIYSQKKDANGKWSKPETVFSEEFTQGNDIGALSFSADGKNMYFTRAPQKADTKANVEVMFSSRAGGEWTEPKALSIFKDSTISVAHPAVSADGQTLYFVSDAPGGQGGKDIWKGKPDGTELKFIENLGPSINTPGDEMFPVVRGDTALYFSSNGLPGLGGLDVFRAVLKDSVWTVSNMGVPLNSNYDDFGIIFEGNREAGYLSSNRGERRGHDAIYRFELPEMEIIVQGIVTDDKNMPIPDATVRLVSNTGQNTRVKVRRDGSYRISIDKNMECVMLATARGFLNKSARLSSDGITDSKIFTVDMSLPAVFRPVQLDNIFFEFAKWDLRPDSEAGLQELLGVFNDNPNTLIEISAHTDYIGNNESNQVLSQKRAQSVVDYLIAAGVDKDRLITTGYGEEKPFIVDEQTAKEYPFLPFETELTQEFILTLQPDEQVVANQINRRTEFRVVRMNYK